MKLVVGLGNPGEKYKNNRHNAGFIVLDSFIAQKGLNWSTNKKIHSEACVAKEDDLILIKPQTFMNDSGRAVCEALSYYSAQLSSLLVVHDDVDLEPLQFRVSRNSSSAGHHGVQDIVDKIGTQDFTRIRVGVGRPKAIVDGQERPSYSVEKYVLEDFGSEELEVVRKKGVEYLLSSLKG